MFMFPGLILTWKVTDLAAGAWGILALFSRPQLAGDSHVSRYSGDFPGRLMWVIQNILWVWEKKREKEKLGCKPHVGSAGVPSKADAVAALHRACYVGVGPIPPCFLCRPKHSISFSLLIISTSEHMVTFVWWRSLLKSKKRGEKS
jgi:hypothetical protein